MEVNLNVKLNLSIWGTPLFLTMGDAGWHKAAYGVVEMSLRYAAQELFCTEGGLYTREEIETRSFVEENELQLRGYAGIVLDNEEGRRAVSLWMNEDGRILLDVTRPAKDGIEEYETYLVY